MWKLIIIAAFSVIWAFTASGGLLHANKKSHGGCNDTLILNNGGFKLNITNTSSECYWYIKPNTSDDHIHLFFYYLFLHEQDELNLYRNKSDAVSGKNALLRNSIHPSNGSITVITEKSEIVIKLLAKSADYQRRFEGYYSTDCLDAVPPDVDTLYSPIYTVDATSSVECTYHFGEIQHKRVMQAFSFEEFNMTTSTVKIDHSTFTGEYKNDHPTDFFIDLKTQPLLLTVQPNYNSSDYFKLKIREVDSRCSGYFEITEPEIVHILKSPPNELNNGSIVAECCWLIQHKDSSKVLGLKFDKVDFHSVFDIAAINNGLSEFSTPLLQVTTSNKHVLKDQVIRSEGSSIWVSYKPLDYTSSFIANVTVHGQGGYFRNSGTISMKSTTGDDTVFMLKVNDSEIVMLNFDDSSFSPPATLSVYDGFDRNNLLTSLHGQVLYPVFSRSSRMMIIGTNFSANKNHFSARFHGTTPGCNHMSSLSTENYILSQNCNSTCLWIIPPQDSANTVLIINLQYISLKEGDEIKIHKLDGALTLLGTVNGNETHVPHLAVAANIGAMLNITQSKCKKQDDKVVVIGHSSYMPACNYNITPTSSEIFQITSPLYPDTYPLFFSCQWNISASNDNIIHLTFENLNLAENHCLKISQNSGEEIKYEGKMKILPDDLFLTGKMGIEFDSTGCNKTKVNNGLNSDMGFVLNVTFADCGAVLTGKKNGEFNTSIPVNKTTCIWKVQVPPKDGDSVNIISYGFNKKDDLKNYELNVYDGSSVRNSEIVNDTSSGIWSRSNTLIFIYKRLNITRPSSVLIVKYSTISCNASMQCDNKVCMHPNWRCDGENDCGDFSDERNCASFPIPPDVHSTGYSAVAFWLCGIGLMIIGIICGLAIPVCIQRYKDSRYTRFRELSGIDS